MKRNFHHPKPEKNPRIWRSLRELENDPQFGNISSRNFLAEPIFTKIVVFRSAISSNSWAPRSRWRVWA